MNKKWNTLLGYYQNYSAARDVLKKLRQKGYKRSLLIHRFSDGEVKINYYLPSPLLIATFAILLALSTSLFFVAPKFDSYIEIAILATLAFCSWILFTSHLYTVNKQIIKRYKHTVLKNETLIIAEVRDQNVRHGLSLLRTSESDNPISFLLRSEIAPPESEDQNNLKEIEPLTIDSLEKKAVELATQLKNTKITKSTFNPLKIRLKNEACILERIRRHLSEAEQIEQTVTISGSWLLDNDYIIQENIKEIERSLPLKYYNQLPKLVDERHSNLPRVYVLATALIDASANRLNKENILTFLKAYQTVDPLTIGELWAFPIMLRVYLIERMKCLAEHFDNRLREGESARFWGNRLLSVSRKQKETLEEFLFQLKKENKSPSPHFVEELLEHLFDEDTVLIPLKEWLEKTHSASLNDLIQKEQKLETTNEVAFSSAVISLISLKQLSWRDIFESTSGVDQILKNDPEDVYSNMNFATRDNYRHAVEILARESDFTEIEISKLAIEMAKKGTDFVTRHVGYYLIDEGKNALAFKLKHRPSIVQKISTYLLSNPSSIYFGTISLMTLFILSGLYLLSLLSGATTLQTLLFTALSIIPVSEISIQLMHFIVPLFLKPHVLPKMNFENGIPEKNKTFVVIPMMLKSNESFNESLEHLEIHYLANSDPALRFGLLLDYTDAKEKTVNEDKDLLEFALKGMDNLTKKYGEHKFFLFLRERVWSESESAWIGWERKRGKLESLNRFLSDHNYPQEMLKYGNREDLLNTRYIITLDADTELPKDKAIQLVEAISHPLNTAMLTPQNTIKRGYTIIQPRVSTDISNRPKTLFSKIYSDIVGINPYTEASSDIYQDLMKEGSYHGKCIYDLFAFDKILSNRFPEEHLLSHDLIEGAYVKVAYASDISLFDRYPETYRAWSLRQHRWIRGDFQIIDWLFSKVPSSSSDKSKPPTLINRWKILDNFRRALTPPIILCLLVTSWLFSSAVGVWNLMILFLLFTPTIFAIISNPTKYIYEPVNTFKQIGLSILKVLISLAVLPHQAFLSLDALVRVIYRRCISKKKLLEWSQKSDNFGSKEYKSFLSSLSLVTIFAATIIFFVAKFNPISLFWVLPICVLWMLSPLIIYILDNPAFVQNDKLQTLNLEDKEFIRQMARSTWRYFDDFVNERSNFLPPDNFQASLKIEIAERTSPTNIGLWMLAAVSAYDLRYISYDEMLFRIQETFNTIKKLETYQGHLLNWYDTRSLKALNPRYVSTVDNGNLLGSLWTLQQAIIELIQKPILPIDITKGLNDTYNALKEKIRSPKFDQILKEFQLLLTASYDQIDTSIKALKSASLMIEDVKKISINDQESKYWLNQLEKELKAWNDCINRYLPWVAISSELTSSELENLNPKFAHFIERSRKNSPSLKSLADGHLLLEFNELKEEISKDLTDPNIKSWIDRLEEAFQNATWLAAEKIEDSKRIIDESEALSESTKMEFLYNKERKLFSIGFHVEDCRLDSSFYDLIASEARISSLVSIAKGDVPLEHWWCLGRPYRIINGKKILVSWGGTMFEYMMPLLYNKYYSDSLLGNGCKTAAYFQIQYGKKRGIPWGISESAFSEIDTHKIYQYRSFGVPELGFKRGLDKDLVVSPYSSALAMATDPKKALSNLKRLKRKPYSLFASHGFYESIDFTRQKGPKGERGIITYAFMAHHQGMSLLAFNNVLNQNIIQERFHNDPRIKGVEPLLYEQVPSNPPLSQGYKRDEKISRLPPFPLLPIMGVLNTPHTSTPKINLLANGSYSVMLTNTGGGYSKWDDIDITRWRSDTTCDHFGSFCYIKDLETNKFWSTSYQPTYTKGQKFSVKFKSDKVEFVRRDESLETITEIAVSPQDNTEIRLITIANLSRNVRQIELTSYNELALAPHKTDRSHQAFNKLFIETESIPDLNGVIAFRRLRSKSDQPIFAAHLVTSNQPSSDPIQFETDRSIFIGRGNTLMSPKALSNNLTNSEGYVLDPIFSLRRKITLQAGERVQVAFITTVASDRETLLNLMKKYNDFSASLLSFEMAWAHSQLDLRHLRIHQEEAQLFQKLASHILFPHSQLRISSQRIQKNRMTQENLWAFSISGDLPIVAVSIADIHEVDLVKQILTAHAFWRMRGLKVDLVILNEEATSYENPLNEQLTRVIHSQTHGVEIERPGGVFLLNTSQMKEEDTLLILSVACVHLVAARGFLRQHLASPIEPVHYPSRLTVNKKIKENPSNPLPFLELPYFNGLGGFTPDGKEYVIYLGKETNTPAPWINVIANPQFGAIITEAGLGCTWYGNSQTNRLTPWSNDPVLNPITDAIYIRDNQTGAFWTSTPSPIRENDAYRISHGQGYSRFEHNSHGIEQTLNIFVPCDKEGGLPLKIQKLTLKNKSSQKRNLCLFNYTDIVLGSEKEETGMHIVTTWDIETQGLFACNHYNSDYKDHVAFVSSNVAIMSHTGNRTEFIGRNHHLANPAALKRKALSDQVGAGFDPCLGLQMNIELMPDEQKEIVFVMGYASTIENARQLIYNTKNIDWVNDTFQKTKNYWDDILGTIHIECPDLFVNFAVNRWLLYQNISCRLFGRSGFYQSSGAFGFRDQLQDVMALLYTAPEMARKQILRTAAQQFVEGDVQHWWLPPLNKGVRTHISDDLLWLPFVTAQYVRVTNDISILSEVIPFIEGDLLKDGQHETFFTPRISSESGTLLEHCRRALNKGTTSGPHGLPLIGGGDWNDGMNNVGSEGKGESIWLAWFLIHVINDFAYLLAMNGQEEALPSLKEQADKLASVIEKNGWDGEWYLRAYMDDGTPLGSKNNIEDMIDSLPQSWSIISGAGNPERALTSLKAVEKHLIQKDNKLVLLLTLPFDKTPLNPGYIKGYPPGVRENGGQYTHGSLWVPLSFARLKDGDMASELLKMMHPVMHTNNVESANRYKIEPYVLAGDVYALDGKVGRGGWSWYTGSSGWMYRIWIEEIFGFDLHGDTLKIKPVFPSTWKDAKLTYKHKSSTYLIIYENIDKNKGSIEIELDNIPVTEDHIQLKDDGKTYTIRVRSRK